MKKIRDKDVMHTLFARSAVFSDRNGGYTRIIKVEAARRQRPDGRHRVGAGEDGDRRGQRARRAAASKKGRTRDGGHGCPKRLWPKRIRPRRPGRGLGQEQTTSGRQGEDAASRRPRTLRPKLRWPSRAPEADDAKYEP